MKNPDEGLKVFKCLNDNCKKPIAPVRRGALVFGFGDREFEVFPKKALKIKCPFCGFHSVYKQENK